MGSVDRPGTRLLETSLQGFNGLLSNSSSRRCATIAAVTWSPFARHASCSSGIRGTIRCHRQVRYNKKVFRSRRTGTRSFVPRAWIVIHELDLRVNVKGSLHASCRSPSLVVYCITRDDPLGGLTFHSSVERQRSGEVRMCLGLHLDRIANAERLTKGVTAVGTVCVRANFS